MSGNKPAGKANKEWAQAGEISEAMLGIQSYSDDSMMFLLRYANQAKVSMRQKDYEEFMKAIKSLMTLWSKPAESAGGPEARSKKATELREECLGLVQEFPDLHRDFDRFVTATRATTRSLNPGHV